jgi:hypothetical protein
VSWSSVTAFLAAAHGGADPQAARLLAAITAALDAEERLVIEAQKEPSARRLQWLQARSGRPWTPARLAHVEALAFITIRRQLQARGLFASDLRAAPPPR